MGQGVGPGMIIDPTSAVLDKLDQIINRLDQLIDLQKEAYTGAGESVTVMGQTRDLLEMLVAMGLPAAPRVTTEVTVGITESMLCENQSAPFMLFRITNGDPAQNLWISARGTSVASGEIIAPNQTQAYVLSVGAEIWGVCNVATISVRVTEGLDLYSIVRAMRT